MAFCILLRTFSSHILKHLLLFFEKSDTVFLLFLSTDDTFPKMMIVPVPVPVYVPVPMNMYSQCTPKPVGLPLPVCLTLKQPLALCVINS